MIPDTKQAAVERALLEAFGVATFDSIEPVGGGLSAALVFRISVKGHDCLLKMGANAWAAGDPNKQIAAMKIAAEAGVGPRVWYASAEDRVFLTDFVRPHPFPDGAHARVAETLRNLHAQPGFPASANMLEAIDAFVRRLQEATNVPRFETDELFRGYRELAQVYPRDRSEWVASHNDLKPQNILFDGRRFLFVDWEAAFLNDRYFDLAVVANFFVKSETEETGFLSAYFGEPADDYRRARFFLMRQAVHAFYVSCFLMLAARAGPIDPLATPPDFRELHRRLMADGAIIEDAKVKVQYALAHLERGLEGMRAPRFAESLALVGGR